MTTKFALKKVETSFYCVLRNVCRYSEPLRQELREWRTDRQTDRSLLTIAQSSWLALPNQIDWIHCLLASCQIS